jgi:hypothetical protein
MRPTTCNELGKLLEEELQKALRMEEIVNPVLAVLAVLLVLMFWSLPVLDIMGKFPKP